MADINNALATVTPFVQKWEGLSSKVAGTDSYYTFSQSQNLSPDTVLYAYPDSGGVWTIGWGTTHYYVTGSGDVQAGDTITKAQADAELAYELNQKANLVLNYGLPANCNDLQFAALISLAYNAGEGSAYKMIDYINNAASESDVVSYWKTFHITDRSGNVRSGLINRRLDETMLYSGSYNEIYSYYLRNQPTILWSVGIAAVGISLSLFLYFRYMKK